MSTAQQDGRKPVVSLLDYGAGNVRSVRNAIRALGYEVVDVEKPEQLAAAAVLVFPGVGSFGACMAFLAEKGFLEPLREYVRADKPYLGICLGMQTLFEGSEETPGVAGLGALPGMVRRFEAGTALAVPQIGWNGISPYKPSPALEGVGSEECVYFVHSFHVPLQPELHEWILTTTTYGVDYVSAVQRGNVMAAQFHPEKSAKVGLRILDNFLKGVGSPGGRAGAPPTPPPTPVRTVPRKRVVACLDVRTNDAGDLVVTKGDSYNVREAADDGAKGAVRNLGKPVALASRYYAEGADEITFLNITGFRDCPLEDLPMLELLVAASEKLFVPLCVGGGIRDFVDSKGAKHSALAVASAYFRAGADKVSIGSEVSRAPCRCTRRGAWRARVLRAGAAYDRELTARRATPSGRRTACGVDDAQAVQAAKAYWARGATPTPSGEEPSCIEAIAHVYGRQAVVISVDPRRVWVADVAAAGAHAPACVTEPQGAHGPSGEHHCWYECTIKGGREGSDLDVLQLARACEALGAGEILLNSIDADGQNSGFDIALVSMVRRAVSIPVIASSGAGKPEHFSQVFAQADVEVCASFRARHVTCCAARRVRRALPCVCRSTRRPITFRLLWPRAFSIARRSPFLK